MIPKNLGNALKHFKKNDPTIYRAAKKVNYEEWFNEWAEKYKISDQDKYFVSLCRSIVGQQLSGKAAKTIYGRLEDLFPKKAITAHGLMEMDGEKLRNAGLSWPKVKYIKDLAQKHLEKEINLETIENLIDSEVIKELTKVKGIGKWTAEMFLIFSLKRENVFSFGDLGLYKGFEKLYSINDPTEEHIEETVEKWTPYKSYGSIALWQCLEE